MVEEGEITQQDIKIMLLENQRKEARDKTADYLINKYHFATMRDTEEIYYYNDGYYHSLGDKVIKEEINPLWGYNCTTQDINEITKAHLIPQTYMNRNTFNTDIKRTCTENGILNLETLELEPFTPEHKFTFQLPLTHNPDADCPMIEEFFNNIVEKHNIPLLYQIIGYCLWRSYPIHKAFMLVGDGSNGKSTFINLIEAFLGEDNVSHIAIQTLINNRFAASELYSKHANLYPDLEYTALKSTGMFKIVTGGDRLRGEKKFRDSFKFKNHAKIIYSANKLPEVTDTTSAFFRRWIIINFPNTFNDDDADKDMINKITTPEELSGLLLKSVIALQSLIRDGKFIHSQTTDEIEERYTKLSNSVAAFVNDVLEHDVSAPSITRRDLYLIYSKYCRNNDLIVKNQAMLSKELSNFIDVEDSRIGNERGWKGLKIKNQDYDVYVL